MAPFVLADNDETARTAARELVAAGFDVRDGWSLGSGEWLREWDRVVCHGSVRSRNDAQAALLCGTRGAGVLAVVDAPRRLEAQLFADLRRLGTVELRKQTSPAALDARQEQILALVARGASLTDVAEELNFSVRTISRRLAQARASLGAATTAEAVTMLSRARSEGAR